MRLAAALVLLASSLACSASSDGKAKSKAEAKREPDAKPDTKPDAKPDTKPDTKPDAPSASGPRETPDADKPPIDPTPVDPDARTWHFDSDRPAALPEGFRVVQTGEPVDPPASWAVVADADAPSPPHAFGVTKTVGTNKTYNLALIEGTAYKDLDLSVMLRPTSGTNNQGGGVVVRAKGPQDHYVLRWNPVENNFRIYALVAGARVDIASAPLELDPKQWHQLHVVIEGDHIECFVDDKPVVSADDKSFPDAGMIGLWTKGDAATLFDDLTVAAPR